MGVRGFLLAQDRDVRENNVITVHATLLGHLLMEINNCKVANIDGRCEVI